MLEKISTSVKERRVGEPYVLFDQLIEADTIFLSDKMKIVSTVVLFLAEDTNRRDYMDFSLGRYDLFTKKFILPVPA
jgi:hypothetical protein